MTEIQLTLLKITSGAKKALLIISAMFGGVYNPLYNQKKTKLILYFGLFSYKPSLSLVPQKQQMNVTNKKRKGSDRCSDVWIRSEGCVLRMKSSLTIQTA